MTAGEEEWDVKKSLKRNMQVLRSLVILRQIAGSEASIESLIEILRRPAQKPPISLDDYRQIM